MARIITMLHLLSICFSIFTPLSTAQQGAIKLEIHHNKDVNFGHMARYATFKAQKAIANGRSSLSMSPLQE